MSHVVVLSEDSELVLHLDASCRSEFVTGFNALQSNYTEGQSSEGKFTRISKYPNDS